MAEKKKPNAFMQFLGDSADIIGTNLHLPELNVSERLAGNRNTVNSGSKPLSGTNAFATGGYSQPTTYETPMPYIGGAGVKSETTTRNANVPALPYDPNTDINGDGIPDGNQSGGGGGGGQAGDLSQIKRIPGDPRAYNLNNLADRQAYYNVILQQAAGKQRLLEGQIDENARYQLSDAERTQADNARTIDRNIEDVGTNQNKFVNNIANQLQTFGNDYQSSSVQRQNAYATRGEGYQSAQGDAGRLALSQFNTGVNDINSAKDEGLNAFGRQREDLTYKKKNLMDSYTDYINQTKSQVGQKKQEVAHLADGIRANTATELDPYNVADGVKSFDYKLDTYNPYEAKTADLSKYNAATSFNTLPGQAGATTQNAFGNIAPVQEGQAAYLEAEEKKKKQAPQLSYQL